MWMPVAVNHQCINRFAWVGCSEQKGRAVPRSAGKGSPMDRRDHRPTTTHKQQRGRGATRARELIRRPPHDAMGFEMRRRWRARARFSFASSLSVRWGERSAAQAELPRAEVPSPKDRRRAGRAYHPGYANGQRGKVAGSRPFLSTGSDLFCSQRPAPSDPFDVVHTPLPRKRRGRSCPASGRFVDATRPPGKMMGGTRGPPGRAR